jgi:SHS2 domain-containing protein
MPYEILNHTADIMLRISAATREGLCEEARLGLYGVVGHLVPIAAGRDRAEELVISVAGCDFAEVLRDWMAELLFRLECHGQLCLPASAYEVDDTHLRVAVAARRLDRGASRFDREVKAVTYHRLTAGPQKGEWVATVILDI